MISGILAAIERRFDKISVTRGKKHIFLGIYTGFIVGGKVKTLMKDYIIEPIEEFGESITWKAISPEE